MTASQISLDRSSFAPSDPITTDDALLTAIVCSGDIAAVTVQPITAGCYVVTRGGSQGGAVPNNRITVAATGTAEVRPRDVGAGDGQAWTFWVARASAGAVIHVVGSVR